MRIEEILSRRYHRVLGWRPSDYDPSGASTNCSVDELRLYLRIHAFLSTIGHGLPEEFVEQCTARTGEWWEDVVVDAAVRRDAVLWHFLVRPHVPGEGWNRRQ